MSFLDQITVLILTWNEEANIGRTLQALTAFPRVLVLDSGSTDGTLDIVRQFPNVSLETRQFDSFAQQCNFGLSRITTKWVLSLDADYILTPKLVKEIENLSPSENVGGYRAHFKFLIHGKLLRASLYPPRTVLYVREKARYHDEGHGHRVRVTGHIKTLSGHIFHDDRKPLDRWFTSQKRYARIEADFLLNTSHRHLGRIDRLRRMGWPMVFLTPFYTLLVKGCLLDGLAGWHYTLQRTTAECLLALTLAEKRLQLLSAVEKSQKTTQ